MSKNIDSVNRNYDVILDTTIDDTNFEDMWFFQGDTGGTLTFTLCKNEVPLNLPEGTKVICLFETKDKQIFEKCLTPICKDTCTYLANIDSQLLQVPGNVKCEVKMYHESNKTTFTPFNIVCKKCLSIEGAPDTEEKLDIIQRVDSNSKEISKLAETLNQVNQTLQTLNECTKSLSASIQETNNKVTNDIQELSNSVDTKLVQVNDELSSQISSSIRTIHEYVEGCVSELQKSIKQHESNIGELKTCKANLIVSQDVPDVHNLPLGTIWVKPNAEQQKGK